AAAERAGGKAARHGARASWRRSPRQNVGKCLTSVAASSAATGRELQGRSHFQREIDQSANGDAGGAGRGPGFRVVAPGGSGDVEMDPRSVFREFLDEPRGSDCASAFAAAR